MVAPGVQLIMKDFHSTKPDSGKLHRLHLRPRVRSWTTVHCANVRSLWSRANVPLLQSHVRDLDYGLRIGSQHGILAWHSGCSAGIAGSCPITIGGGTIADTFDQKSRGAAMALFAMGPLMGPVIGPVAGGYLNPSIRLAMGVLGYHDCGKH